MNEPRNDDFKDFMELLVKALREVNNNLHDLKIELEDMNARLNGIQGQLHNMEGR